MAALRHLALSSLAIKSERAASGIRIINGRIALVGTCAESGVTLTAKAATKTRMLRIAAILHRDAPGVSAWDNDEHG